MTDDSNDREDDDEAGDDETPDHEAHSDAESDKEPESRKGSSSRSSTFWGIIDRIDPRQALSYVFGRKVCIFGPSRAGKTTLYKFIAKRVLPEYPQKSMNTVYFEWKRGVAISYKLDDGSNARFWLKYVEDSAGDSEMDLILKETADHRPNFIFFVFDASRPTESLDWMRDFTRAVKNSELPEAVRTKLKGAAIILNKCDGLDDDQGANQLIALESELLGLLDKRVKRKTGLAAETVETFKCCFLKRGKMPKHVGKSQHSRAVYYMAEQLL
jgi:hypothetical protein